MGCLDFRALRFRRSWDRAEEGLVLEPGLKPIGSRVLGVAFGWRT